MFAFVSGRGELICLPLLVPLQCSYDSLMCQTFVLQRIEEPHIAAFFHSREVSDFSYPRV